MQLTSSLLVVQDSPEDPLFQILSTSILNADLGGLVRTQTLMLLTMRLTSSLPSATPIIVEKLRCRSIFPPISVPPAKRLHNGWQDMWQARNASIPRRCILWGLYDSTCRISILIGMSDHFFQNGWRGFRRYERWNLRRKVTSRLSRPFVLKSESGVRYWKLARYLVEDM